MRGRKESWMLSWLPDQAHGAVPAVGSFVSKLSAVVADAAAVERSMVQVGAQRGWFKDSMRVLG